jgi:hypothetical protein
MSKKIFLKTGILFITLGALTAISIGVYMWLKPHRNVQNTEAYATLQASELINEFNADAEKANARYLSSDGNSKVLIIEGTVFKKSTNQNNETVILLKDAGAKAGVSATFTSLTSTHAENVKEGDKIKIKGAITAGNSYDADLDLFEHAILVQCDIVKE